MIRHRRAVVTGAAGFIGSHMVDLLLESGYEVVGVDNLSTGHWENLAHHAANRSFQFEQTDVCSLEVSQALVQEGDVVFHFAGRGEIVPSIEKPADYVTVNVMGTVNMLEAARKAGAGKFVYAASSSCYGLNDEQTDETADINPQHPYALSKRLGEEAVLHWGRVYQLPVVSMRIFNAYGPRARTTGAYGAVFGVFLAQKAAGKPYTVVSDGTQRRDFVHVTDVVRAFLLAAESEGTSAVYNVGTGHPRSINELVALLEGEVVHVPQRPGEPNSTWADSRKARQELGWEPQVSFEEGVADLVADLERWRSAPLWEPETIGKATSSWFSTLTR